MMPVGDTVGPYQIAEKLGAGGMGEVYKAQDTRVGRFVALKILPESLAADTDRRRRFEQEARLAAALNHPNVMAIYDVGLDGHPPYIVAELVSGESLRSLVARGPVPPRRAADIAAQMAAGLAAAHAAGIVHRDLKPENVMVATDGAVKILDFGVARIQTKAAAADQTATIGQTAAGAVVGTAAYMSPEQARAQEVDYRSDQFSLGLVLYEMVSGRQAFTRPSAVQTMSAIVEDEPQPLERSVPAQLRWILDRCLAKEREARYESTRDLARELAQVRDHYSELTGGTTSQPAAVSRPRRRVSLPAAAAAIAVSALAAWCGARLLAGSRAVDLSRYKFTPFATSLAQQYSPAWSPDGKSIAFLGRMASGKDTLFVQPIDSATAVPISGADAQVDNGAPFWSPDSRMIYYRCTLADKWGLCSIAAGGGSSILVQKGETSGSISPDGRTLVTFTYPDYKLWVINPIGSAPRPYTPAPVKIDSYYNTPALAFAPDGRRLIFGVALTGRGETSWLLPWPPGAARRIFPQTSEFSYTPQWKWLPDSRHLVFAESSGTYMADVASGRYWPILRQDRAPGSPTVSPDGSRMAYVSDLSHTDVIAVPLGDGPIHTLLTSSLTQQQADIFPNAQQVVFVSNRGGTSDIWTASLADGAARPLVSTAEIRSGGDTAQFLWNPALSRDGKRVAFVAKLPSSTQIYTVFASGGAPVEATSETGAFEVTPSWSPDGNWLVYQVLRAPSAKLMKVRPASGERPIELGNYWGTSVPQWSPTGEWIACYKDDSQLVLVSPDGTQVKQVSKDHGPVAWSTDGKTLYQVQGGDQPSLVELNIATGQGRKLRDLGDLSAYSSMNPGLKLALMPDGKSVVFTVNRPRREIWILNGLEAPRPWYRTLLP